MRKITNKAASEHLRLKGWDYSREIIEELVEGGFITPDLISESEPYLKEKNV